MKLSKAERRVILAAKRRQDRMHARTDALLETVPAHMLWPRDLVVAVRLACGIPVRDLPRPIAIDGARWQRDLNQRVDVWVAP